MDKLLTQQECYDFLDKSPFDYNVSSDDENEDILNFQSQKSVNGSLKMIGENNENPTNITLCVYSSTSYDDAYRNIKNDETCKVNCYVMGYEQIKEFYEVIINKKKTTDECYVNFMNDLDKVAAKNVMIYFECCSYLSANNYHFPDKCIEIIEYFVLEKKYLILCADFSLKALINDWNVDIFGKNPMVKYEDIEEQKLEIEFEKNKFADSGLKQLKIMSDLVDDNNNKGKITLHVLDCTISFKLDSVCDEKYNIDVLSVVKKPDNNFNTSKRKKISTESDDENYHALKRKKISSDCECVVKKEKVSDNFIGQAVINFTGGGKIFISNGHFSELCNINCTDKSLFNSIEKTLGKKYYEDFLDNIKNSCDDDEIDKLKNDSISLLMTQTLSQVD